MIIPRLFEMFGAKKEQMCSDFLQNFLFDTLVSFHDTAFKEYCKMDDGAAYFITDCYTYITRDRALTLNSIIESELNGVDDDEYNALIEDLKRQDDHYCNGIVLHRKLIFNNKQ
jgi:hypothetical protein